jgi:ubiquinone/menaquinone biosynthesis C-methylase UbiE
VPVHEPTRRSYDTLAEAYEHRLADELTYKPLDRALLTTLVEQCPPGLPLADLGCGPGHVAGWLATQGAPVVGIDLSPGMVAVAAARHPDAQFRVGDLLSLPASDGEFGSAVCFYSIIHLESHELEACFAEVRRVLVPGGRLLLASTSATRCGTSTSCGTRKSTSTSVYWTPTPSSGCSGEEAS